MDNTERRQKFIEFAQDLIKKAELCKIKLKEQEATQEEEKFNQEPEFQNIMKKSSSLEEIKQKEPDSTNEKIYEKMQDVDKESEQDAKKPAQNSP